MHINTPPGVAPAAPGAEPFPIRFQLADADGQVHAYEATPHPPTEGMAVAYTLLALGAEPLGAAMASVLTAAGDAGITRLSDLLDADVGDLANAVDFGALGRAVRDAVATGGMPRLTRDLLSRTFRDGKPLNVDVHFNAAFACNYFELAQAAWQLVQHNRFMPPLPTLPGAGSGNPTKTPA